MKEYVQKKKRKKNGKKIINAYTKLLLQISYFIVTLKDDYKTELCSLKTQLSECQENQTKVDERLNNLLANMRTMQEEKNSLEARMSQRETSHQSQVFEL